MASRWLAAMDHPFGIPFPFPPFQDFPQFVDRLPWPVDYESAKPQIPTEYLANPLWPVLEILGPDRRRFPLVVLPRAPEVNPLTLSAPTMNAGPKERATWGIYERAVSVPGNYASPIPFIGRSLRKSRSHRRKASHGKMQAGSQFSRISAASGYCKVGAADHRVKRPT